MRILPAGWVDGSEWGFAVEVEGRYAGTISLRNEGPGRAEIAFGSHPDVRGTGAMERACQLLVGWGFDELELDWHWDQSILDELAGIASEKDRIGAYLRAHRPHLLKVYDADALAEQIAEVKARQLAR